MELMVWIQASWDPDAGVYTATSDDVPGLVAEAATLDELDTKLEALIPEMIELNGSPRLGPNAGRLN